MKITDIDYIVPITYDRLHIVFKDGSTIDTTEVYFKDNDALEFGYIFKS